MARDATDLPAERVTLLLFLATFLFVGGLRAFLSSVYYQNLSDLGLNITAAWSLLLLAPALFLLPSVACRPRIVLIAAASGLALARAILSFTRGTAAYLPLAGIAAASWLMLLGALFDRTRPRHAVAAGIGVSLGWALDVALMWYGDSADPSLAQRGLFLVLPIGALLVWLALRPLDTTVHQHERAPWAAGAMLGGWLFLENTILGNPYGAARWNGVEPALVAAASVVGLVVGALVLSRGTTSRVALIGLHVAAALALAAHAYVPTALFPLLLALAQVTMAIDVALLIGRLAVPGGGRALLLTGLVALVLHFIFAFTYLFAYVPLGALWEGRAPLLIVIAAGFVFVPLARRVLPSAAKARRPITLIVAPVLVAIAAIATPAALVDEPSGDVFRVLTFNVHQGFANDGVLDAGLFGQVLAEEDPDVVLLQESDTPRFTSGNLDIASYLSQTLGYHLVYGQPTREQAFGGAILSRHPVLESHVYALPSMSDNRFFTEAKLLVDGRDVWFYAVHFTLPRDDRLAQTDALLAQAATRTGPLVIAGDLNSCPVMLCPEEDAGVIPDDVYARVTARYHDAWVVAGGDANDTRAYTYDAADPFERIDYVFVSESVDVVAVETVTSDAARRASDHLPVRADLRLRG